MVGADSIQLGQDKMDYTLIKSEDLRELKNASEMDEALLKSIQDEYFKRAVVYSSIKIIFCGAFALLCVFGVIPQPPVMPLSQVLSEGVKVSDAILSVLMILAAVCATIAVYQIVRCVNFLMILSKIKKQNFMWCEGTVKGRQLKYPGTWGKMESYYSIDDKYFAGTLFNPKYRKGTEVYFLYFPGFSESLHFGGAVIRKTSEME